MIDTGLAGKVVLVTGAHHGIGAAVAGAFAAQGARVAVHVFTGGAPPEPGVTHEHYVAAPDDPQRLADELVGAGAQAAAMVTGDLSEPDEAARLFDAVQAEVGALDVLVNNAAHCQLPDGVADLTGTGLHRTYTVNLHAPALLTAELVRRRLPIQHGTAVVNVTTDAARAFPGQVAYGTSKAALEAFTRAAAVELGPLGIRVNAVAPGPVQTGWMTGEMVDRVVPTIPLRRVGYPADVADAVVFLASTQARWITGQVIQVAGGHAL